ncbi:MAG: RNA polymerase sigma-70 factor [Prevotella sp.]|nr:RNA polymerase sigma-70 factor [Prevotella sp.]
MNIAQEIIDRLVLGDHDAFHRVFKEAYPKVYAFSLGFIKNADDAEDIAQTVFIRLWTKREVLASVNNLDSYLYVITKNTVLNHLASRKAFTVDISAVRDAGSNMASPQEQIEATDLQLLIDMVVSNMPPQRQAVYRMSREEGLTNDEIASRMGLQKKTVENHLNLALNEIRNAMVILILLLLHWG